MTISLVTCREPTLFTNDGRNCDSTQLDKTINFDWGNYGPILHPFQMSTSVSFGKEKLNPQKLDYIDSLLMQKMEYVFIFLAMLSLMNGQRRHQKFMVRYY